MVKVTQGEFGWMSCSRSDQVFLCTLKAHCQEVPRRQDEDPETKSELVKHRLAGWPGLFGLCLLDHVHLRCERATRPTRAASSLSRWVLGYKIRYSMILRARTRHPPELSLRHLDHLMFHLTYLIYFWPSCPPDSSSLFSVGIFTRSPSH